MNSKSKEDPKRAKHPGGRPTEYTIEWAKIICDAISSSSKGIMQLCRENKDWPDQDTFYKWKIRHPEFADLYYKAKKAQMDYLSEEMLEIADDTSKDYKKNKNGDIVGNNELVNRSRLKIDTRKWLMAKLLPRVYGDKVLNIEDNSILKHADALKELE